ncbi:MAG: 30S ribosomal protein S30e [Candidatus Bathyarchaeota archaeon]|jgi:small subunit ribosomal protein S30e|nr:30S ribosomal protein S30e [Candidatus Bathyarchaeota archaeon]
MPTHGSLTKAGKVRAQTPKMEITTTHKSNGPSVKNRNMFVKRIVNAPTEKRFGDRRGGNKRR